VSSCMARYMFWWMASAVPRYQSVPMRCWGGTEMMNSPTSGLTMFQPTRMWRSREKDLYWVSTATRRMPELRQLERVKSMIRYLPPNGTAGLARSRVRGHRRLPSPPARIIAMVRSSMCAMMSPCFALARGLPDTYPLTSIVTESGPAFRIDPGPREFL